MEEMDEGCRVSVCIPTYNGGKYIQRQLESILCQLSENDEVIISDDSSEDDTLAVVESFHDKRIKILEGNVFHSTTYNMENAMKTAKGKYLFLSDQDDVWKSNKVEDMLEALREHDLVVSDCAVVDSEENILVDSFFARMGSGKGFCKNLVRNTYMGCCMAFRREVLDYVLPFPVGVPMHDSWIGLKVEWMGGRVLFLDKVCMLYRRHGENASTCSEPSGKSFKRKLVDRWILFRSVLKRVNE